MKQHKNIYSMSSAQRKRYIIFCLGFLAILLVSYFVMSPARRRHNARMLCMALPDYNLAVQYEKAGYDEDIFTAFLEDPYTEMYYEVFNEVTKEKYPDIIFTPITVQLMTDSPVDAADSLEAIYTSLRDMDEDNIEKNWQNIADETADRLKDKPEAQNAYDEIYEKFNLERETEELTEAAAEGTTEEISEQAAE